jgi:Sec-independent protein translocase protein TatA
LASADYHHSAVLAFFSNLGFPELLLIVVVAVLIFGKNLPQAASKAYVQARKLRNAVDDLRRETGIDRELRDIERNVREAEWEARKMKTLAPPAATEARPPMRPVLSGPSVGPGERAPSADDAGVAEPPENEPSPEPPPPTGAAS